MKPRNPPQVDYHGAVRLGLSAHKERENIGKAICAEVGAALRSIEVEAVVYVGMSRGLVPLAQPFSATLEIDTLLMADEDIKVPVLTLNRTDAFPLVVQCGGEEFFCDGVPRLQSAILCALHGPYMASMVAKARAWFEAMGDESDSPVIDSKQLAESTSHDVFAEGVAALPASKDSVLGKLLESSGPVFVGDPEKYFEWSPEQLRSVVPECEISLPNGFRAILMTEPFLDHVESAQRTLPHAVVEYINGFRQTIVLCACDPSTLRPGNNGGEDGAA